MTFRRLRALQASWEHAPPAVLTMHRIATWLGLVPQKASRAAQTAEEALKEAALAGLPVVHGRPDDPMLDLCGL